ncbi:hypothetical protein HOH45_00925 [bacterium]|nr:hypothetical protein [bacterium]
MNQAITIKLLTSTSDFEQAIQIQDIIWGKETGSIPYSVLKTATKIKALAIGAFQNNTLVGFLYSAPGLWKNELIHWSYRTAILPTHQNMKIGHSLKLFQKEFCKKNGFHSIVWSFDPLETRNAHFNINKNETIIQTYEENMYEGSKRVLHTKMSPDRLIVECPLNHSSKLKNLNDKKKSWLTYLNSNKKFANTTHLIEEIDNTPTNIRLNQPSHAPSNIELIHLPLDYTSLTNTELKKLHLHLKTKFQHAFSRKLAIISFYRNIEKNIGAYVLN